jgi:hypothetical protein
MDEFENMIETDPIMAAATHYGRFDAYSDVSRAKSEVQGDLIILRDKDGVEIVRYLRRQTEFGLSLGYPFKARVEPDLSTVVAEIAIDDHIAAQIRADGTIDVVEPSARLDEILVDFRRSVASGSLHGLTPVMSTCYGMDRHCPEFRLIVNIMDWIVSDIVGG